MFVLMFIHTILFNDKIYEPKHTAQESTAIVSDINKFFKQYYDNIDNIIDTLPELESMYTFYI